MKKRFHVSFLNFETDKDSNEASGPILLRLEFRFFLIGRMIDCDNRCHDAASSVARWTFFSIV